LRLREHRETTVEGLETLHFMTWRHTMQDAVMLMFTAGFFAVAFLYVKACGKLR
jgi:hypothetical protein